jgi:transposase
VVLARHAGIDSETGQLVGDGPRRLVISSDFYAVYTSAGKKADGLVNLYCLAHVRRHFVRAGDANPTQLRYWTAAWLERIKALYAAHEQLMTAWTAAAAPTPAQAPATATRLAEAYGAWGDALDAIDAERRKQMAAPGLQEPAKKALATLDREWDGLAAHRDYPMISLDNNAAERALRRPVVTRKNAYGSRTDDAARLAARVWTITATAERHHHEPLAYLTGYLDACANADAKAPKARPCTGSCPGFPAPPAAATTTPQRSANPADTRTEATNNPDPNPAPGHQHGRAQAMPSHAITEYLPLRL